MSPYSSLSLQPLSIRHLIAYDRIHLVQSSGKRFELHGLCVLNLYVTSLVPLLRNIGLLERMNQHIERTNTLDQRKIADRCRQLPHHVSDLRLYLFQLLRRRGIVRIDLRPVAGFVLDLEVPTLQDLFAVYVGDDHRDLLHLVVFEPLLHLAEHVLQERYNLLVFGHKHRDAVLLHAGELLRRIDSPLEQDGVDAVVC